MTPSLRVGEYDNSRINYRFGWFCDYFVRNRSSYRQAQPIRKISIFDNIANNRLKEQKFFKKFSHQSCCKKSIFKEEPATFHECITQTLPAKSLIRSKFYRTSRYNKNLKKNQPHQKSIVFVVVQACWIFLDKSKRNFTASLIDAMESYLLLPRNIQKVLKTGDPSSLSRMNPEEQEKGCVTCHLILRQCKTRSYCVSFTPPRAPMKLSLLHSIVFSDYNFRTLWYKKICEIVIKKLLKTILSDK